MLSILCTFLSCFRRSLFCLYVFGQCTHAKIFRPSEASAAKAPETTGAIGTLTFSTVEAPETTGAIGTSPTFSTAGADRTSPTSSTGGALEMVASSSARSMSSKK